MERTFALDRIAAAMTIGFVLVLWLLTRRYRTLIHHLTLENEPQPLVLDLALVHQPEDLVAELRRRTRAPFSEQR